MVKNFMDLSGRVAVVIGGTSGLGRAIAVGLAEAGADVIPSGRRQTQVDEVCAQVEAAGRKTLRHTVDISGRASIDTLRNAVLSGFGKVDVLVNAAGRTKRTPTKDLPEEEWAGIMDTNLTGM
ncbi:MAG: SDR family NAD(P)-dependent oxidoreductase, partial [Acidobacteriota bacterium]|nr:SDR family NAD(P)-dependent oxidoreductase [Acidobacteriota bacterium]